MVRGPLPQPESNAAGAVARSVIGRAASSCGNPPYARAVVVGLERRLAKPAADAYRHHLAQARHRQKAFSTPLGHCVFLI
jgi:hypothetical protein